MSQIDNSNITDYLNKVINPTVKTQIYSKSLLWQMFGGFKADSAEGIYQENNVNGAGVGAYDFKNNTWYITIRNGRVATAGIPVAGTVNYGQLATNQGNISPVITTGAFQMPKSVLNYKDAGAIVKPLTESMSSVVNSLSMDLNRQCYGDGSATLAVVAASGTSTTVTLKPRVTVSTRYNGDINLEDYFPVKTYVKVGSNAVAQVSSSSRNAVVLDATQTLVADTSVLKYNGDGTALSQELTGLQTIVDDTDSYAGIDPATDGSWASYEDNNSSTARTMANTITAMNKAFMRTCKVGKGDSLFMNITAAQKYAESFTDLVRFKYSDDLGGGFAGFDYMGGNARVTVDNDCPDDEVFILDKRNLGRAELWGLQWENGNTMGGTRIAQKLDYEFIASGSWQIYTDVRASHAKLREIVG